MRSVLARLAARLRSHRVRMVYQLTTSDCGAACLAMVLRYHGRRISLDQLRDECPTGRDGITARAIVEAARRYGLTSHGYRTELSELSVLRLPAIVHWSFNHFMVLERCTADSFVLLDPAGGRRAMTIEEFGTGFTGVVLTFEGHASVGAHEGLPRPVHRWYRYLGGVFSLPSIRARLALALVSAVGLQLLGLAPPLLTRLVVDVVLPLPMVAAPALMAAGMAWVVATQAITSMLRARALISVRVLADTNLLNAFVKHLLTLPGSFFSQRSTGDIVMRLASNATVREAVTTHLLMLVLDVPLVICIAAVIAFQSSNALLFVTAFAGLQLIAMLATYRRMRELTGEYLTKQASEQSYLIEIVRGIATVKGTGAASSVHASWARLLEAQMNVSSKRAALSALVDTWIGIVRGAVPMVILWWGSTEVLAGRLSTGTILALSSLAGMFLGPVGTIVSSFQQFQLLSVSLGRVLDVLDAAPEKSGSVAIAIPPNGSLEVKNVSFSYEGQRVRAIRDVSFRVQSGQKIAIVGPTGSGKSTLLQLLCGLHQPDAGDLLFDGRRLAELDLASLRSHCGLVLQEPTIFAGSIRDNICLGRGNVDLDDVERAAWFACLDEDVRCLPLGYDTQVGEGGRNFSGGQRQRIAIARAIIGRPTWLFLDEATSHLDTMTEAAITERLRLLRCTRVIAAHRLSTVKDADLIVVLVAGSIVDVGTHEELVDRDGTYRSLLQMKTQYRPGSLVYSDSALSKAAMAHGEW